MSSGAPGTHKIPRRSSTHGAGRRRSPVHPVPATHRRWSSGPVLTLLTVPPVPSSSGSAASSTGTAAARASGKDERGDRGRSTTQKKQSLSTKAHLRQYEADALTRQDLTQTLEHRGDLIHRRCQKPDAIWSVSLTIIGVACLVIHSKTPRLKSWQDRTVSPAVCVGSILAFSILWMGHLLGWSAHKMLPRVWSLIAFLCFGMGLAGTLDGMEVNEGEPTRRPMLIKVAAFLAATLMHWGNFLMSMARQEKPLVQRQETTQMRNRWREGILV